MTNPMFIFEIKFFGTLVRFITLKINEIQNLERSLTTFTLLSNHEILLSALWIL